MAFVKFIPALNLEACDDDNLARGISGLYLFHRVIAYGGLTFLLELPTNENDIFICYILIVVKLSLIKFHIFFPVSGMVSARYNLTCYLHNEFDEGSIDGSSPLAVKRRCANALWLIISRLSTVVYRHLMKYSELEHRRIRVRPEPVLITNHHRHCARIVKNYSPLL